MSPVCPEPPDPRSDLDPTLDASTLSARSPDLTSPHSPSQPPQRIGDYVIIGKLGEGGMGVVYEAEQQHPKRRVALKVVRGGHFVSEIEIRMFEREAETLARLKHPNIAAIHESGRTEEGQHFFAMELVRGETLDAYAKRHAQTSVRERLRLFRQICEAVNYAHQRGVIHRDLKPSNIIVVEEEEAAAVRSGTGAGSSTTHISAVKILDFGLARITDADAAASIVSEVGAIKGTLPYMSPEQARGNPEEIDLRTDVYALGVILYQLLAGSLPYDTQKSSILEAARVICEEAPRPIRAGGRDIDADLETVVLKALEKEPDLRYQSAGALADDVERYLLNQPILAHPPSTMYQVRKLVARHKGRVVALGAIAALLVALTATMIVQAGRVRDERDRATAEAAKSGAINQFLIDALGGADPWGRGSRSITLVDALHQARGKSHTAFESQPLVEASVLQTLGTTFGSLAEFAVADTALRAALDLRVAAAGRRSDGVAEALGALADLHSHWGKFDDAEKYSREALDITRELHGVTSLEAAAVMIDLATALSKKARLAEAKELAEESLRITRESGASRTAEGGSVDPGKIEINALTVLGEIALNEDDGKAMEKIERERLALVRSRDSGQNAELAWALNDLGTAQTLNGDLEGAERTYQEAIEMARGVFGDNHPEVAIYRENLGNAYYRAGKLDQTASNLEVVLAMRRNALGDDSEAVARTLANMAVVYRASGNNDAAERTYREAVERLSRKLGAEHPDVGITLAGLGDVLRKQGKFLEAESTLRRALAILVKANGEDHAWTQRAFEMLASLYTDWKKPAQAAEYTARVTPQK